MTEITENTWPFFARINAEKEGQLTYWAQKFSISTSELRAIISITGTSVKDIHEYLQTLRPPDEVFKSETQVITSYKQFVDATVMAYLKDYKTYRASGGQESFFIRCWWAMMNETVQEAERILEQYAQQGEALTLSKQLQKIAEDGLLHLNEFQVV